ncbi:MAG TPA: FkbM family methyltransferase [Chthoniobacterales bacterium]|jgi:FkbM family methyltransferase
MRLRKLLQFILPNGLVELARNRRRLGQWGHRLKPADWLRSAWLVYEAEQTGLALFPPGFAGQLRHVVDVGANAGQWSGMLLDLLTPESFVMIEPGPAAFAELRARFGGNPRVRLHNVAVGAGDGAVRLKITRDTTGASLLQPKEEMRALIGGNWAVTGEVDVGLTTLDHLLADMAEVSLLKIDVQGYEQEVLAGGRATLAKTRFLLVELNYMPQYEGGSWLGELHETLTREHGFFLANASKPLCLNGRASMCDGLYVNPAMVHEWVKPDFV